MNFKIYKTKLINNIMKFNVEEIVPCQLKHIKLSCWGCCGRNYKSQKKVERDIFHNTERFKKLGKVPSTLRLLQFRDRLDPDPFVVKISGICSNLVKFDNGVYACPLHPMINEIVPKEEYNLIAKKDLRQNYCDVHHECEALRQWQKMSKEQKEELIHWIEKQNFDHYSYSIANGENQLIWNFLDEK